MPHGAERHATAMVRIMKFAEDRRSGNQLISQSGAIMAA
jgi:hypothetical protein